MDTISNPFETLTRRRFAVMDGLLSGHDARCVSQISQFRNDPDFAVIYGRVMEARTAWNVAYLRWTVSRRTHKGRTFAVNQLIAELRGRHIGLWQLMIERTDLENQTWIKGTPAFERLFPEGRRPFQQGGIDSRLNAVGGLCAALDGIPALTDVRRAVGIFHTMLTTARRLQLEVSVEMKLASAALETQRRSAAGTLYRNMARLMEKFADDPPAVRKFFDPKYLTKSPPKRRALLEKR
ncbi:MAG TPA: hypothetical protein VHM91_13275 [Verrucomicrobiales bacterium]|nr:hypothetical protein [Verrucomicrobiales bacterium]